MSEENLNLDEDIKDIFDETDDETNEGEESKEEKVESDQEFIDKVNKETGKNFKSIEAITQSLKQMDKVFAEKGKQKKEVVKLEQSNEEITEELLLIKNPEAETVLDDVKAVADQKYGGNRVKAYREETWLQEKAKIEMQKEENIKKIKSPSSSVRHVEPSVKVTDEDKRIADKYFGGDIARYLKVKAN